MSIYSNLALEQSEIIDILWRQNRRLLTLVEQREAVSEEDQKYEEEQLEEAEKRMGGRAL